MMSRIFVLVPMLFTLSVASASIAQPTTVPTGLNP